MLPYVQGISERISRILRQQQIKVAFKPLRTLNSLFPRRKAQERVDQPQSGTMYKISCTNCSFVYYGQTERSFKTRIAENKRAVSKFDHNSKSSCHVHENNHEMNFRNVRVVGHEANYHERLFLGAWFQYRVRNPEMTTSPSQGRHPRGLQISGLRRMSLTLRFQETSRVFPQRALDGLLFESRVLILYFN